MSEARCGTSTLSVGLMCCDSNNCGKSSYECRAMQLQSLLWVGYCFYDSVRQLRSCWCQVLASVTKTEKLVTISRDK